MKIRKGVFFVLLASGVVLGLSTVSFPIHAGGRTVDQSPLERAHRAEATGQTYLTGYSYIGRRVDHPEAMLARRTAEQADLARFEEGRPATPRRTEYPYIGRRVDALR
jgi:hypothetical protein